MALDHITSNGRAKGRLARKLMANGFDPNCLRPYIGDDGESYITIMQRGKPRKIITNADALLLKDEWIELDRVVIEAAMPAVKAYADLRSGNGTMMVPNGMGKLVLQYQTRSDVGDAELSMDGKRRSKRNRHKYDLRGMPLPIMHFDFGFSLRELEASRNGNNPLDLSMADEAGRKIGELAEKMTLGVGAAAFQFAGDTLYGYTNYPKRLTQVLTNPEDEDWTPAMLVQEILQMKQYSMNNYYRGPWRLYFSQGWDEFLDDDYSGAKGDNTLRERIMKISGIESAETLDFLDGWQAILVDKRGTVARAVVGMELQTVQWEEEGGMDLNFKAMAMWLTQLRHDFNERTGIVHGVAPDLEEEE